MFRQFSFIFPTVFLKWDFCTRPVKIEINVVFNILMNIMQANDQKKLKKMVEELANKYGKTEDEIFYAYDQ